MFGREKKLVIDYLNKVPADVVLEVGFGMGGHSTLLRSTYPQAYLVGYERNIKFDKRSRACGCLNEYLFEDFHGQHSRKYDLVTMGAYDTNFWWKFNVFTKDTLTELFNNLLKPLKDGGSLIFVIKLECYINSAEKAYNQSVNVLFDKDKYAEAAVSENILDTLASLSKDAQLQQTCSYFKSTEKVKELILCKDEEVDAYSKKMGQERGHFAIFHIKK